MDAFVWVPLGGVMAIFPCQKFKSSSASRHFLVLGFKASILTLASSRLSIASLIFHLPLCPTP